MNFHPNPQLPAGDRAKISLSESVCFISSWYLLLVCTLARIRTRRKMSSFSSFGFLLLFPIFAAGLVSPRLVVLIPAYNEADRIGSTLDSYQDFLAQSKWDCKILVVDDGSSDCTSSVVQTSGQEKNKIPIQCVSLAFNQGKGAALERGIEEIVKQKISDDNMIILILDADGSGDLSYLDKMMNELEGLVLTKSDKMDWSCPALVTGNRNYNLLSARGITRWGFQTCVSIIMGGLGVQDTQCGYKLVTLSAADLLYKDLNLKGWAHDVEVLYRAKLCNVPVTQISIDWQDKEGSKVAESGVVRVSTQMLLDILRLRWEYSITGTWKPPTK
jgi:dolichyl-phosphate beta-glucosyltransferase